MTDKKPIKKIISDISDLLKSKEISGDEFEKFLGKFELDLVKKLFRILSDRRINTIDDILSKSEISVITPNIWEDSANLIRKTQDKFKEWKDKIHPEIKETRVSEILDRISITENIINASIFNLYKISRTEIKTILQYLNVPNLNQLVIIKEFSKI